MHKDNDGYWDDEYIEYNNMQIKNKIEISFTDEDDPIPLTESAFSSLGAAPIYNQGTEDQVSIPYPLHYCFRGPELKLLSRFEYYATVKVKKKHNCNDKAKRRKKSQTIEFGKGHPLKKTHHQIIKSKQSVVITFGKIPIAPSMDDEYIQQNLLKWKRYANKYAKYILILFHPESALFETGQKNKLGYLWEDLQEQIQKLQKEDSLISRLQLKSIYNHSHVLKSNYINKAVLSKFRARIRDVWNEEDIKKFSEQSFKNRASVHNQNIYDQHLF